ncbi:hypothetical protein [Thiohalospira sp.]|uniref:hypothetical protein n=1 Tax=Thiohalospira sp. TaxID=3080549 RepID=UPI00397F8914
MAGSALESEREHLGSLLEALQRCVYFLDASERRVSWPLRAEELEARKKDVDLFESLAAVNERFAKLQDTLGASMRHAALLAGESAETFLKVLAFFEKVGILESMEQWQVARAARNLAAHDYELEYAGIAEHFNQLHELAPTLYQEAERLLGFCREQLHIEPVRGDFGEEFRAAVNRARGQGHE